MLTDNSTLLPLSPASRQDTGVLLISTADELAADHEPLLPELCSNCAEESEDVGGLACWLSARTPSARRGSNRQVLGLNILSTDDLDVRILRFGWRGRFHPRPFYHPRFLRNGYVAKYNIA